jgi:hypothetical protein
MCGGRCNIVTKRANEGKNFVLLDLFIIAAKVINDASK